MISYKPDVLGARIRQIFPMYPTVRPSTDTIIANAMSESIMTGKVRLSGEALQSINEGMRPETILQYVRCIFFWICNMSVVLTSGYA